MLCNFCPHSATLLFSIACRTSHVQLIGKLILMTNTYLKFSSFPTTLSVFYSFIVTYHDICIICPYVPFGSNQSHFLPESFDLCSYSLNRLSSPKQILPYHENSCVTLNVETTQQLLYFTTHYLPMFLIHVFKYCQQSSHRKRSLKKNCTAIS